MINDNVFNEINEILLKKKECLQDLYDFSINADFTGGEDEIIKFEEYLAKRQNIIDSCTDLDDEYYNCIENINIAALEKHDRYIEIEHNKDKIKNLSEKILAIDKEVNTKMQALFNHIKKELHQIKVSKQVNRRYQNQTPAPTESFFFDKKN